MAFKQVFFGNSNISVNGGELYRLSCDIRIDSGQIMDFIQRIYPNVVGLSFNDYELVVFADSNSPVDTVINIKANYRPTANGTIQAGLAVETDQLEDNVLLQVDNFSVEGPKCLSRYPQETYNFIRWNSGQELFLPLSNDYDSCGSIQEIPNAYAEFFDRGKCRKYRPLLIPDEELSFQLNFIIPDNPSTLTNLKLALIDQNGVTLVSNVGTITKTTPDVNGDVYLYGTYTPDTADVVANKEYRLVIYNTVSEQIFYVSNPVKCVKDNFSYKSVYLSYRNSANIDGYNYKDLPSFRNKVRVELTRIDAQPEIELTQYQEASTGLVRNQKTQAKKVITLQSIFFDDYAHDAMLSLSLHDDILINNVQVQVKTAYKVETNVRSNTNLGTIEVYDQKYSTVNLAGNTPN